MRRGKFRNVHSSDLMKYIIIIPKGTIIIVPFPTTSCAAAVLILAITIGTYAPFALYLIIMAYKLCAKTMIWK